MSSSEDEESNPHMLNISEAKAAENYYAAGISVREKREDINCVKYEHLILNDKIHSMILEVEQQVQLPFKLTDMQRISLHVLGNKENLILISPTGSGKMLGKESNLY